MGIVMRTIQYDSIFSVSFMYDTWDFLRQTSPNVLSRGAYPVYMRQSRDFGGRKPLLILVNTQTTSDRLIAKCGMVRNPCNMQSNTA